MEIKAVSDLSYEAYKQFFKITMGKMNIFNVIIDAFLGLCILVYAYSVVTEGMEYIRTFIMLLILSFALILLQIFMPKLSYKRTIIKGQSVDEYTFMEDSIHIASKTENISSESDLKYNSFLKVYENSRYAFLYIAKERAYIVDKQTVTGGNFDRVRDLLIKNVGIKKYRIKF